MGLVTSKIRLYVEYAMLAVLLGVAGLAVTLKIQTYRQQISITNLSNGLEKAQGEIEVITSVNAAQEGVIKSLSGQRESDNLAVTNLLNAYDKLRDADQRIRSKLDTLEKTDAQAKAYFDSVVPESVACVYDDSCTEDSGGSKDGDSKADSTGGPVTSLLLAPEEKARNSKGGYGSIPKVEGKRENVRGSNGPTH